MQRDLWRRLIASPAGIVGAVLLAVVVILALTGPFLAPHDPTRFHASARLAGRSMQFWLGTDQFGRDILSRLLAGAPSTILFGVVATGIATVLGITIGLLWGHRGGVTDTVIMRVNDSVLALPTLVFALLVETVFGASSTNAVLAVAVATTPSMARIARGVTLSVVERDYVRGAIALVAMGFNLLGDALRDSLNPKTAG